MVKHRNHKRLFFRSRIVPIEYSSKASDPTEHPVSRHHECFDKRGMAVLAGAWVRSRIKAGMNVNLETATM